MPRALRLRYHGSRGEAAVVPCDRQAGSSEQPVKPAGSRLSGPTCAGVPRSSSVGSVSTNVHPCPGWFRTETRPP
jgi:hypothetical protein